MWFWRRFFSFSVLTVSFGLGLGLGLEPLWTRTWLGLEPLWTWTWLGLEPLWTWTCLGLDKGGLDYSPKTNMWLDFDVRGQQEHWLSHWRKHYNGLWTHISSRSNGLKWKCLRDGFASYKYATVHLQDVNWWTGVVWIIVICLSTVVICSSASNSDGTHS